MSLRSTVWSCAAVILCLGGLAFAEEVALSPQAKAHDAIQALASSDPYLREQAFLRLEALRDPTTVPELEPYLSSQDSDMRAWSLRALAAIEGPKAVPALLDRLSHDRVPHVRWAAILGLEPPAKQDLATILPPLIKALRDRDTEVRIAAVDVVSRIDHPLAREAILVRAKREGRRDVRRVMAAAVKRVAR